MVRVSTIPTVMALLASPCATLGAQTITSPGLRPRSAVAIPLRPYFRDLRSVQAIRGRDTLEFLFDTGGGSTVISPEVAARLGCRPFGRQVGHRMHGDPVEFQACDSISFTLGRWAVRHAPVAVFDVNALLPPTLPKLAGVLSLDTFRGQVITIDWSTSELIVHALEDGGAALAAHGVPARFATGDNGGTIAALLPVRARRGTLWFLLDSGNIAGTLLPPHVLRDSLLVLQPDSTVAMRIGPRPEQRLRVTISPINLDGVLGTAWLRLGPVTLDLRSAPRVVTTSVGSSEGTPPR